MKKLGYDFIKTPCCNNDMELDFKDRRYMNEGKTITQTCPHCGKQFGVSATHTYSAWIREQ